MIIRCPNCGESGVLDSEPEVGQHVECPFCCTKFSYGVDQNKATSENAPENVQQQGVSASSCVTNNAITKSEDSSGEIVDHTSLPCGLRLIAKHASANVSHMAMSKETTGEPNSTQHIGQKKNAFSETNIKPKKKFCQECGNELHPKAIICPKCGCPVATPKQPAALAALAHNDVPDYMVGAIISMFLFLPMGLVAMYYVLQSRQKVRDGNRSRAEDDSRMAGLIVKWTIGIAVVVFVFWFIWGLMVGHAIHKEMKATDDYIRNATREAEREAERLSREAERIMRSADYYY